MKFRATYGDRVLVEPKGRKAKFEEPKVEIPLDNTRKAVLKLARRRKRKGKSGAAGYYRKIAEDVDFATKIKGFKHIGELNEADCETYKRLIDRQEKEDREYHRIHKAKQRQYAPSDWRHIQENRKVTAIENVFAIGKATPRKRKIHRRLIVGLWNYLKKKCPIRFERIRTAFKTGHYDYNFHSVGDVDYRLTMEKDALDNYIYGEMKTQEFAKAGLRLFARCPKGAAVGVRITVKGHEQTFHTYSKRGIISEEILCAFNKLIAKLVLN